MGNAIIRRASEPFGPPAPPAPTRQFSESMGEFGVPAGFDGNVRAGMITDVGTVALQRAEYFKERARRYKAKGTKPEERRAIVADLAEQVRRTAVEADPTKPGSDPVVVADTAAALVALGKANPKLFDDVMRQAGNPELFWSLRPEALGEIPEGEIGTQAAREAAAAAAKQEQPGFSQEQVPLFARRSSVMVDPAYEKTRTNKSTGEREPVLNDKGQPVVVPQSQTSKNYKFRPNTLYTMAGDQIAQIRQIKKGGLEPTLPKVVRGRGDSELGTSTFGDDAVDVESVADTGFDDIPAADMTASDLAEALAEYDADIDGLSLKQARAKLKKLRGKDHPAEVAGRKERRKKVAATGDEEQKFAPDSTLTVGTRQGTGYTGDRVAKWGDSGVAVDQMVEQRNMDYRDRLVQELYRVSGAPESALNPSRVASVFEVDPNTKQLQSASVPKKGWSVSDEQLANWLDSWVPEWRAGFPQIGPDGAVSYPDRAPSAKFLANLIWSLTEVDDPGFAKRIEPFLQQAIDAAPAAPNPEARAKSGARNAAWYSQHAFIPGAGFAKRATSGPKPGSPDYPASIYDDRPNPKVVERPAPLTQPEAFTPTPVPQGEVSEAGERLMAMLGDSADQEAGGIVDTESLLRQATGENDATTSDVPEYDDVGQRFMDLFREDNESPVVDTEALMRQLEEPGLDDQAAINRKKQSPLTQLLA